MTNISDQIRLLNFWETPIFLIKNPDHSTIKDDLKDYIYSQEKLQHSPIDSNVAPRIKSNLSESEFNFLNRDNKTVSQVAQFIIQSCSTCISNINRQFWGRYKDQNLNIPKLEVHESWYHVTRTGGYHGAHAHPNCSWCAIYYVDIGEKDENGIPSGRNTFFKPIVSSYYDPGMDWFVNSNQLEPPVEDGDLVLFPSYLYHNAFPYMGTKKDRIVIALNMRVNETK